MGEQSDRTAELGRILLLAQAAEGDTAFRDVYLRRARQHLHPILPENEYRDLASGRGQIDQWLEKSKAAVARQDWALVQTLSKRAAGIRRAIETNAKAFEAAEIVYDAPPVAFDPMSRGLESFACKDADASRSRAETMAVLRKLEGADSANAAFYAARREHLDSTVLPERIAVSGGEKSAQAAATPEQQALAAAQRGDVEALQRLAERMLESRPSEKPAEGAAPAPSLVAGRLEVPVSLKEAFPAAAVAAAPSLGLEHVTARHVAPGMAQAIHDFVLRYAPGASAAVHEMARDGIAELRASIDSELEKLGIPELTSQQGSTLAENVSLFALHLYVNCAGSRYVPLPVQDECLLVESHADGDETVTPLLAELGLDRRRGLSRLDIESALLEHGDRILEEKLGLDPLEFRLIPIPPDVFMRLGGEKGWGKRPEWTHLDGYQVIRGGRLRALVGGNSEFGGIADLCAISPDDARHNVLARFVVVRRARLAVRLG